MIIDLPCDFKRRKKRNIQFQLILIPEMEYILSFPDVLQDTKVSQLGISANPSIPSHGPLQILFKIAIHYDRDERRTADGCSVSIVPGS